MVDQKVLPWKKNYKSRKLIEQFMLVTNIIAGNQIKDNESALIRYQPISQPDESEFSLYASILGIDIDTSNVVSSIKKYKKTT